MLLELLLSIFDCSFLHGIVYNNVYPEKLSDMEEEKYIKELFDEKTHKNAREKLILHNLRLVAHIAKKYESKDENFDDLISIGTIGLIKAIDTFSLDKNVKLATYSVKCIENEILMVFRSNKKLAKNISINESIAVDKDGTDINLIDVLPNDEIPIEEQYEKKQQIESLRKHLHVLDEREYKIISLRYGLNNEIEHTQKEISKKYKISRSYVSRIEKRALIKLLNEFKKNN
ncbi:MAG: sigma-70 family RNA polymerase sigma factor [Erysipelotrichaceae bacterium]|nr:sigma-70 family RNA polymerase sigma factor [Erysipelotrichaceae bacterium]